MSVADDTKQTMPEAQEKDFDALPKWSPSQMKQDVSKIVHCGSA
jgi:hypothetical protein